MKRETKQAVKDYILKWAGKMKIIDMSHELQVSTSTIGNYAKELKVCLKNPDQVEQRKLVSETVKRLHAKKTASQIARILNVSLPTVMNHGILQHVEFKKNRRNLGKQVLEGIYFNERARENWLV